MPLNKNEVLAKLKAGEDLWKVEIGKVNFHGYEFDFPVNFHGAIFTDEAIFSYAQFIKKANFSMANFGAKADFVGAKFADTVIFEGGKNNPIFTKGQPFSFRYVIFEKPARVIFRSLYLGNCSFINTDVSQLKFIDVIWGIKKEGLGVTRKVIYNEESDEKDKNYRLIEETYRQLKKNYEGRGSYGEAGDFHYGELEMQRLAQGRFFQYVSINTMYKILSGYGEKHWRALFWLCASIGLFASLYLVWGIKPETGDAIRYRWALDLSLPAIKDFFGKGVLHAFEVATLSSRPAFTATSALTRYTEIAQRIITPILVTLAILAIRRKFKR